MLLKKSTFAALACAVTVAGTAAAPAAAGEITSSGKPTDGPANANSICVFSGLNDDPAPGAKPSDPLGKAQSYGQELKAGEANPRQFNPGDACRGGSNFARQR